MDINRNRTTNVKGAAFHKQAKDNLQSILDNFLAIISLIKVDEVPYNQVKDQLPRLLTNTTDDFEMRIRAYNMVRAFESLLKLVSDLKDQAVLYDFRAINDAVKAQRQRFKNQQSDLDTKLISLRDRLALEMIKFEDEYSNKSVFKTLKN
ncbi:unnamed protein product [Adineta steineri]|uniref:Mediator of RNA polymerase II transcription subunit 22 n=1 Tax=Adineta steineri TaxID=433720 RepID=A0A814C6V2_9BILA|nr:unnamed protein product [Adineta steineri]CAF0916409.1 unnamed protein product [Adineta steineri]CAF0931848.1 unnamed protein product [Adineta steineri]CAF0940107.1 unnamed protein product [Adineta steineri]CAF0961762.1 unnamed protein product [Adineta steineri]